MSRLPRKKLCTSRPSCIFSFKITGDYICSLPSNWSQQKSSNFAKTKNSPKKSSPKKPKSPSTNLKKSNPPTQPPTFRNMKKSDKSLISPQPASSPLANANINARSTKLKNSSYPPQPNSSTNSKPTSKPNSNPSKTKGRASNPPHHINHMHRIFPLQTQNQPQPR